VSHKSKKAESNDDADNDYMTDDNGTDEESTIEKEEELEKIASKKTSEEDDELLKLQMENDLPLDVLLKDYNIDENYFQNEKLSDEMDVDSDDNETNETDSKNSNESSDEEEELSTENEEDDEYSFPEDSDEELDDEETIEAEERIHGSAAKYSAADELAELEADNQMPLDELLNSFKNVDQIAVPDTSEDKTLSDTNEKALSSSETAPPPQDDKVLTSIAATAQSLQPTGYTLETTKVKTIVPSLLLKHTLREYQHVGLDWLVTMYENKLNGILADEMGLGKTIQTIALLAHLACEKGIWGPHLIVVPTSVMLNWELEFKKWCPGFKILTYYGNPKERKLKRQVKIQNY
jgi:SNF2 family DNA or RNA helicase